MGRMHVSQQRENRGKRYVTVVAITDTRGDVTPTQIIWSDGTRFDIQRVLDSRPARSMTTGQEGTRYKIRVRGQDTYLWFEGPRWFVEAKMGSPG
jgi:hypothetical protein